MATEVRAWFHDVETVGRAVERLIEQRIPEDQIRVTVEDASGQVVRQIPVKERGGALDGALRGALVGAVLAVVAVLIFSTGAFTWVGVDALSDGIVLGLVRAAGAGAMAGVPIGGLWGWGSWKGIHELDGDALREGAAVVTVTGDGLGERARSTLRSLDPARLEG